MPVNIINCTCVCTGFVCNKCLDKRDLNSTKINAVLKTANKVTKTSSKSGKIKAYLAAISPLCVLTE